MLNPKKPQNANAQTIALFIPSLIGGGAERVMVSLANGFAHRGIHVDLVLVKKTGAYLAEVSPKVRIIDLKGSRTIFSLFSLSAYLRREKPAVMLSALNYVNVIAIWAKFIARSNIRLIVSEHTSLTHSLGGHKNITTNLLPWLMKKSYPKADAVVAVSDGAADNLSTAIGLPRSHINTLYNPIETDTLASLSLHPVNNPWFAQAASPVIVGAGRLCKEKDFTTLIHAFNHLRTTTSARLVIIGEGEERPALEALINSSPYKDDILLPGFQNNPYSWMRAAAVFVLSSKCEGFGNVLVEAMACGTPVVSTSCPSGPDEILEGGRWGRLVAVGDALALATALKSTLLDEFPPDVKKRARDFSVDKAVKAYLEVLSVH